MSPTAMSPSPAAARPSPRQPTTINTRPTTRLHVFVAGGGEPRELGLGYRAVEHPNGSGGTKVPVLNTLLDVDSVGVVQVAVGLKHAAALTHDGRVLTWGSNIFFALGRETVGVEAEATPGTVPGLEALDVVQVAATDHTTWIVTANGWVYGWGSFMVSIPRAPYMISAPLLPRLAPSHVQHD
ncbi:hypothetical protein IMZ48_06880 [Candidatus Bathyarchaeota archaeon]|nr:hypothetical protein [Candidatus Bathyarchaeota archaeon]